LVNEAVRKLNGKTSVPFGPFQAPPTRIVRAVVLVVGAVPHLTVRETVIVVVETAVIRPINTGVDAPSLQTLAVIPTATPDAVGSTVTVKTPVVEFQLPFVAV
jgi:hypothetical protein